jgi:cell division transport system permease protein
MSNVLYSIREALRHFVRNWSTVFGAVVTIFLSLFMIGVFVLGSSMLTNLVGSVEDRVTIQAFLSDSAKQADIDELQEQISTWDDVESVRLKSKDEALEEYRETMSNRNASDAVAALDGENPVPASLVIKLADPQQVRSIASRLAADAAFAKLADDAEEPSSSVQYGRETVERLFSVTNYVRIGALVLVGLLVFVSSVFINNTIRLAIAARRREIAIERLVGASNSFIRGPFVAEGMLEALLGSLLAIVALHYGMTTLVERLEGSLQFLSFSLPTQVIVETYLGLVLAGLALGAFGSAIAMRRYLKV